MNKKIIMVLFIILSMTIYTSDVEASSLANINANTAESGWALLGSEHMGTKTCTYKYLTVSAKNAYSSYVTGGIALWGNNISMTYDSSSTQGTIQESLEASTATASTSHDKLASYGHVSAFTITIYKYAFNNSSHTAEGKKRTIAHEIGHVYGLAHVANASDIMYPSYSKSIKPTMASIWGMKVVTHTHIHSSSTSGTVVKRTSESHVILCSSCKAHYYSSHVWNSAKNTCTKCGYTVTVICDFYLKDIE